MHPTLVMKNIKMVLSHSIAHVDWTKRNSVSLYPFPVTVSTQQPDSWSITETLEANEISSILLVDATRFHWRPRL